MEKQRSNSLNEKSSLKGVNLDEINKKKQKAGYNYSLKNTSSRNRDDIDDKNFIAFSTVYKHHENNHTKPVKLKFLADEKSDLVISKTKKASSLNSVKRNNSAKKKQVTNKNSTMVSTSEF